MLHTAVDSPTRSAKSDIGGIRFDAKHHRYLRGHLGVPDTVSEPPIVPLNYLVILHLIQLKAYICIGLRLLDTYASKIAIICNLTFRLVIQLTKQLIKQLFKIVERWSSNRFILGNVQGGSVFMCFSSIRI